MQLREFSLITPKIQPGELLKAISTVIAPEVIGEAIEQTKSQEQRNRILPTPKRYCPGERHEPVG